MKRSGASKPSARARAPRAGPPGRTGERAAVAALLAVHAALAVWGAAANSVTYDENYHVPAGFVIVTRGNFDISPVNPPLVKAAFGVAALAAGARPPDVSIPNQVRVGESFMRLNAARYQAIYVAARLVSVALSVLLGLLIWRWARRLYGARGGLLSLAFYALSPEALAHAGVASMDVATGLGFLASTYGLWNFARTGRTRWWCVMAAAIAFTMLTRFTALLLFPMFVLLALVLAAIGQLRRPRRMWIGLALLVPVAIFALDAGYLGQVSFRPLSRLGFQSDRFVPLARALPWLRLPLPDSWLAGLDRQSMQKTATYLLGRIRGEWVWYYFPLALAFKWPLALLGAVALRAGTAVLAPLRSRRVRDALFLAVPPAGLLVACMVSPLNAGIRYLFPLVPFACVWLGGLAVRRAVRGARRPRPAWLRVAPWALAGLLVVETAGTAPWYLTFFNWPSGGPGGGYRLVNDSNVDWGQGLIGLRAEMKRLDLDHIYLSYHGTTDPAVYGIDYTPYVGDQIQEEDAWLAISSYYFVGLSQRMMTSRGPTRTLAIDFRPLWDRRPDATAANCIYLFHLK